MSLMTCVRDVFDPSTSEVAASAAASQLVDNVNDGILGQLFFSRDVSCRDDTDLFVCRRCDDADVTCCLIWSCMSVVPMATHGSSQ